VPLCWILRRDSSDYTFATNARMYRVLAHLVANTVAHVHRQRVHIAVFMTRHVTIGRSAVRAQPLLFQRLIGLFVACCVLVLNSLQTSCPQ